MGEYEHSIRAPGIEPDPPPPGDGLGEKDAATGRLKLNPLQVRRALRGVLRWAGTRWARKLGDPRIAFSPMELDDGAEVWYDLVEAFWPELVLGPKAAALVGVGFWGYGTYESRKPLIVEAAKRRHEAMRKQQAAAAAQAGQATPPAPEPEHEDAGPGDVDDDESDGAEAMTAPGSLEG